MDLSLTSTQEILRDSARDFLTQECPRSFVRDVDETATGFSPELWQKMSEMGWVGMVLPEQYGGGGSSFMDLAVLSEEMGSACLSTPLHSSSVLGGSPPKGRNNSIMSSVVVPAARSSCMTQPSTPI